MSDMLEGFREQVNEQLRAAVCRASARALDGLSDREKVVCDIFLEVLAAVPVTENADGAALLPSPKHIASMTLQYADEIFARIDERRARLAQASTPIADTPVTTEVQQQTQEMYDLNREERVPVQESDPCST